MPIRWQFQLDNDPKHTAQFVKKFLEENVTVLNWPSKNPDLNPIENLWQAVKTRMANKCSNLNQLYTVK